jgi:hypothetical protein
MQHFTILRGRDCKLCLVNGKSWADAGGLDFGMLSVKRRHIMVKYILNFVTRGDDTGTAFDFR